MPLELSLHCQSLAFVAQFCSVFGGRGREPWAEA
jgi:hypothetical protein